MADVELIIKGTSEPYVKSVREAQKATQELNNTSEETTKRRLGLIEQEEKRIQSLTELRRKSTITTNIEFYNKQIDQSKNKIQELEKAGVSAGNNVSKGTDKITEAMGGLVRKLGPVALALGLITKVAKGAIDAFKDTTVGLNLMTTAGEFWRQVSYNIATGNFNMMRSFEGVARVSEMINKHRVQERKDIVESSQLREEYNQLYFESSDRTQSLEKQLNKLTEAQAKHNELIDVDLGNTREQLRIVQMQLILRPKSNKLLDEEAKLLAEINSIEGRRFSEIKRVEMRRSSLENEIKEKKKQAWFDEIEEANKAQDELLKQQKEFQDMSLQLIEDYEKSRIDSLTGPERLHAERAFALKQLEIRREAMMKLGKLTPEMEELFRQMGQFAQQAFVEGMSEEIPVPVESKNLFSNFVSSLEEGIQKDIIPQKEDPFIWKILGLDPNSPDDQEKMENALGALKDFAGNMVGILEESFQQRVDLAQRERELLDDRIGETQREIELEAELAEAGFANSLTARRAYLDQLKIQRDQALQEEQKAMKAQQLMDTVLQTVNLITASSNIYKALSPLGPLGIGLAIAAIATMFASFAKAKAQAIGATKLAEGASGNEFGIIKGKSHSQGGEHFLNHVEVEHGERWGVLNSKASAKYGDVFNEMVSSFNRDEMPEFAAPQVTNSVRVDNNGPNSRLDKVNNELKRLNAAQRQPQQTFVGNKRIIRKGNNVRIIG